MAEELLPGSVLQNGNYKIIKALGLGVRGITYKALRYVYETGPSRSIPVVIKEFFMLDFSYRAKDGSIIVHSEFSIVRNYMNQFKRQAESFQSLNHRNINKVLNMFCENNTCYVVYEFIDGITVDDYVISKGRLSESDSLSITKEIGSALWYMHSMHIFHLNINPRNMIISKDNHDVYLVGYGLLKDGVPETYSTIWELGSPWYSPIERMQEKWNMPMSFDIYGLAASLYRMLTGHMPPQPSDILNDGFPTELLLQYSVSSKTIACLEKAMSPKRKARYQTIDDFFTALNIPLNNDVQENTEHLEYDDEIIAEKVAKTQALPIGTKLHGNSYDYEIKDVLGQGSFGITYLADLIVKGALGSLGSNIRVAIKEFFMRDVNGRQNTTVTAGSKDGIYGKYKEKITLYGEEFPNLKYPLLLTFWSNLST